MIMGGSMPSPANMNSFIPTVSSAPFNPAMMNPVQKMRYIMQAMTDPAGFIHRVFPDTSGMNDANQIFNYLQQTRNISNEQIQQVSNQAQQAYQQMPR